MRGTLGTRSWGTPTTTEVQIPLSSDSAWELHPPWDCRACVGRRFKTCTRFKNTKLRSIWIKILFVCFNRFGSDWQYIQQAKRHTAGHWSLWVSGCIIPANQIVERLCSVFSFRCPTGTEVSGSLQQVTSGGKEPSNGFGGIVAQTVARGIGNFGGSWRHEGEVILGNDSGCRRP